MKNKSVIIAFGILIALSFLYASNFGGIKTMVGKGANSFNKGCPEKIIPEKVTMVDIVVKTEKPSWKYLESRTYLMMDSIDSPRAIISNWKDGEKIQVPQLLRFFDYCRKGNAAGENKNYYYCENLVYNRIFEEVSKEGDILEKGSEEYIISLELKPLGSVEFIESKQLSGKLYSLPEVKLEGETEKGKDYDVEIQEMSNSEVIYGYKTPYYITYEVVSSSCKKVR